MTRWTRWTRSTRKTRQRQRTRRGRAASSRDRPIYFGYFGGGILGTFASICACDFGCFGSIMGTFASIYLSMEFWVNPYLRLPPVAAVPLPTRRHLPRRSLPRRSGGTIYICEKQILKKPGFHFLGSRVVKPGAFTSCGSELRSTCVHPPPHLGDPSRGEPSREPLLEPSLDVAAVQVDQFEKQIFKPVFHFIGPRVDETKSCINNNRICNDSRKYLKRRFGSTAVQPPVQQLYIQHIQQLYSPPPRAVAPGAVLSGGGCDSLGSLLRSGAQTLSLLSLLSLFGVGRLGGRLDRHRGEGRRRRLKLNTR
jgi:hypothetical protein